MVLDEFILLHVVRYATDGRALQTLCCVSKRIKAAAEARVKEMFQSPRLRLNVYQQRTIHHVRSNPSPTATMLRAAQGNKCGLCGDKYVGG